MDINQFEQLIAQLLVEDNNIRGHAETLFNEMKKGPDSLILSLSTLIRNSKHDQIRALSVVLLRRLIGRAQESLWTTLQPQTQTTVKTMFLQSIETEELPPIRSKVADAIAELATKIFDAQGTWDELLPFMFQCSKSQADAHRESALLIFSDLATYLGEKLRPYFEVLKDILASGLTDNNLKVRIAALAATANFLQVLNEPHERSHFQQLTPAMLGTISTALGTGKEDEARTAIELFVDLAELDPTFLRPHLVTVITAMITIATTTTLEDNTRQSAMEFLVTLAENRPGMLRKLPKFLETLVPVVLNFMLELEDDPEWNQGEEEDEVDITNADVGEESLDRLSIGLGGKQLVPVLFSLVPQLLNNPDWRHRHTALMSLSIIGEGCEKYLTSNLPEIVKTILPFFQDPHPRVRWAACNTVGQMSTDFGPQFQSMFHAQVLPALIGVMDDVGNPRVQSHAAAAIINFCEHCQPSLLNPYLDPLLAKLYALLQQGKKITQEQAITAIAAVADCSEGHFVKYYDTFVPILKTVLNGAVGKEFRVLRGKAMECISLIGVAVGKEKFLPDAREVLETMIKTQSSHLDPDDPQISFLLQSFARMCRCLKQDFVPYLQYVMPPLLQSAKLNPDVTITDADAPAPSGFDYIPVGDKRIGINTSALEEKSVACNMLYCYANELKEGFFPYVDEVAKLMVPLLKFYYHDGVRGAAATILPLLMISAKRYLQLSGAATGADTTYTRQLFQFIFPTLIEATKEEIDMETLVSLVQSLSECLDAAGEGSLSPEQMQVLTDTVLLLFNDVRERRQERAERKQGEDHDEEEEERITDEDERDNEILAEIGEVLGKILKHQKHLFMPHIEKLLPTVLEFCKSPVASDRQTSICVFDDIVEYTGLTSLPLFQHFVPFIIQAIGDPDAGVRQAAVYGIGLIMQNGSTHVASIVPDVANRLNVVISHPESRKEENINATENAISAIGKILQYQSTSVDVQSLTNMWLSWLPVTEDKIESRVTYGLLCHFIETSNAYIFGQNFSNLPKILSIFGEILETDLIDETIERRIKSILKQLQSSLQGNVLQTVWGSLALPQQQKLHKAVSS